MTTQSSFILDIATVVPTAVAAFVFFTLAALIFGARPVRERADGTTSFFSFDGNGGGDTSCSGGCGAGCGS